MHPIGRRIDFRCNINYCQFTFLLILYFPQDSEWVNTELIDSVFFQGKFFFRDVRGILDSKPKI